MADWSGFDAKTLKSMIRTIDNKIAYRNERIEKDQAEIASMESTRADLAAALDDLGDSGTGE
jgi:hypothetical protein